jgi:hypothetical protein
MNNSIQIRPSDDETNLSKPLAVTKPLSILSFRPAHQGPSPKGPLRWKFHLDRPASTEFLPLGFAVETYCWNQPIRHAEGAQSASNP